MENISQIEEKININIDLLEIAKDYCEFHNEERKDLCSLMSLIGIVLKNQKMLISYLDKI